MEIDSYRRRERKIALPHDGRIPETPAYIADEEQRAFSDWISRISRTAEFVGIMSQSRTGLGDSPTHAESVLGWKKWMLSHHLFIPMMSLAGHALTTASEHMRVGQRDEARKAVQQAARLRRGCGALFLYSVDFKPCSQIYCSHIRSQMPPAFSGYEIRERQNGYQPALALFNTDFAKDDADPFVKEMRKSWISADVRYHELHERCMIQAVVPANGSSGTQKPESLRAAHRRQHGEVPPISEESFAAYDRWFGIQRCEGMSWLDFAYELFDVVERVLADLMVGHRLEPEIVNELIDSIHAVLEMFGEANAELLVSDTQPTHKVEFVDMYGIGPNV